MKKCISFLLLLLFLLSLFMGQQTFQYTQDALILWFEKLVPSLFISMVLVRLLFEQQIFTYLLKPFAPILTKILNIDQNGLSLVVSSILLGYPTSSTFIDQQAKQGLLTHTSAKRLLYTCSFATPGFMIMSCGVVLFQSSIIGWKLFAIQLLCGFILLLLTRSTSIVSKTTLQKTPSFMKSLSKAIFESGKTLYLIGGYLMFVMTLTSLLFSFFPESSTLLFRACIEFSSGIVAVATTSLSPLIKLLFTSALLGFGGFCVHMQVMSMLENVSISYFSYLAYRLFQALLAVALAYMFFH